MNPLLNKKQLFVTLMKHAGSALVAVLALGSLSVFIMHDITRISNSLTEEKRLTLLLEKREAITHTLASNLIVVGENEGRIRSALLPVDNILQFVGSLEGVASETSVTQQVHFGTPVPYETPEDPSLHAARVDYTASLRGNIVTFTNYLKAVEQLPYFAGVSAFNFNSPPEQGWKADSDINIRAKIYVTNAP
jgi:hypothetical protein